MPFGARLLPQGEAEFRLWAPSAQRVELVLNGQLQPLAAAADGWFVGTAAAAAGDRYAFRIDANLVVPDPASRHNPDDVHGASRLIDPEAFDWPDAGWRGRPWHEAVIYELHVGCFTEAGSFTAAIERLDDLVALGITAIELMPVADFPGQRGWGYDGVLLFAPDASYGTPDELKRLVAAAHARGLMVLLDVVYNHFGPDGNYLHVYAQTFFDRTVHTPWGAAINFGGEGSRTVREFFIHNALYWIEEFHFDGLRVDAVHAMQDDSALHFIDELAQAVRNGPGRARHVHLVLENDVNDAARLARTADGRPLLADAQWNDDVHHALHVLVSGERDGYYIDYAADPLRLLGRALAEGFAYQGDPSAYREGEPRGTPSTALPPLAFVNSMQTHDQVGNRAFGERIAALADAAGRHERLRALVACVLLSPAPPMLFMGEEFAASSPFLYFCDFSGDLAQAVTQGRRAEFSRFALFADPARRATIPDPNALSSFQRSKLDWAERDAPGHAEWCALYRHLLALRRDRLMPLLPWAGSGYCELPLPDVLDVHWPLGAAGTWHLRLNLSSAPAMGLAPLPGETIYASAHADGGAMRVPNGMRVTLERR
ncbi:MAG: malto-oligosyltrehalose trehalohydrolase [Burkholderiaceae bacterium]